MASNSNKNYSQNVDELKAVKKELKELYALESSINEIQFKRLESLEKQKAQLGKTLQAQKQFSKEMHNAVGDFEDIDDTMISIGNQLKKNTKFIQQQENAFAAVKIATSSIAMELAAGGVENEKTQKQIIAATNAYKGMHSSIADIEKQKAMGSISDEQRVALIKEQATAFRDVMSVIDMTKVSSEELKSVLTDMGHEGESFAEAMKTSQINSEGLDRVFGSFSGIPAMGELNTLLKTNIKDTLAFKAAVFALGAALGGAAMEYFGAPMKAALQQYTETQQLQIDGEAERAKIAQQKGFIDRDAAKGYSKIQEESDNNRIETAHNVAQAMNEAAFAGERAANQFNASMQSGAAQFNAASKTALFGKSIGSIGYGAAQMNLAGIGADQVASAMTAAADATGKMPTSKAAADMAVMAARTGQSVEGIASLNEMFQRVDGASADTAINMQEGLRAMADSAGINLGGLMQEMSDSSKDMLGYQIKSGAALAKQVTYARSMGVSFSDIAKAGQSMVLNYKDSIKSEMQLSAMLGKNVDLSEVRSSFASGDTEGALKALKAQGLDPAKMDMFQQQQLQQATGMDLTTLSKISSNTGKSATLKEGNAKAGNQSFLGATEAAQRTLSSQEASISAQQAIIDAELSGKIADSFINSDAHKNYLKALEDQKIKSQLLDQEMESLWKNSKEYNKQLSETSKLNFLSGIMSALMTAIGSLAGGAILSKLAGGGGGGIMGMFSKAAPAAGAAATGPAAAMGGVQSAATSVGGAGGGGAGGALKGIASGLASFANPATLVGLAAITIALKVLEPVIASLVPVMVKMAEVVGDVLVKALEMAGPIITSIFNGIGTVINSIGTSIATIITALATSISMFAGMNPNSLLAVAGGVTALAVAVGAFGVGNVIAAVGSFFGGGVFDDLKDISKYANPILATANSVKHLASAFNQLSSINLDALSDVPWLKMTAFAAAGGEIVVGASAKAAKSMSPGNKSVATPSDKWIQNKLVQMNGNLGLIVNRTQGTMINTANTTNQLKVLNTNTTALVNLTKRIEALTAATYKGETIVKVDGKTIAKASAKYNDNLQAGDPNNKTGIIGAVTSR